jgi:two-component system response regulator HupR/HoxA
MNAPSERPVMLCVDDDPAVLRSLERLFREEPVRLLSTLQPELALRWVQDHDVRLLLTDQRMPEMSGIKLVEEVMLRSPGTACVILTAYPKDVDVLPDFLQDTYEVIAKPWDGPSLKSKVRQILRERELEDQEDRETSGE